jgi:hypothetical protein
LYVAATVPYPPPHGHTRVGEPRKCADQWPR